MKLGYFLMQGNVNLAVHVDVSDVKKINSAVDKAVSGSSSKMSSLFGGALLGIGAKVGQTLTSGLGAVYETLSDNAAAAKTFSGVMETIGRGGEVKQATKDMKNYAAQTVFSTSDMLNAYGQLAAAGVKDVGKLVKGYGGLAGATKDPANAMSQLLFVSSQIGNDKNTKLYAQDWNQVRNAIGGSSKLIQDQLRKNGAYTGDFKTALDKGAISAEEFQNAISEIGNQDGFQKLATQPKTIGQAFQQVIESISNNKQIGKAFDKINKTVIKALGGIADFMQNADFSKVGTWLKTLAVPAGVIGGIGALAFAISKLKKGLSFGKQATGSSKSMKTLANAFGAFLGLAGVALIITSIGYAVSTIANSFKDLSTDQIKQMSESINMFAIAIGGLAIVGGNIGKFLNPMQTLMGLGGIAIIAASIGLGLSMIANAFNGMNVDQINAVSLAMGVFAIAVGGLAIIGAIIGSFGPMALLGIVAIGALALAIGYGAKLIGEAISGVIDSLTTFVNSISNLINTLNSASSVGENLKLMADGLKYMTDTLGLSDFTQLGIIAMNLGAIKNAIGDGTAFGIAANGFLKLTNALDRADSSAEKAKNSLSAAGKEASSSGSKAASGASGWRSIGSAAQSAASMVESAANRIANAVNRAVSSKNKLSASTSSLLSFENPGIQMPNYMAFAGTDIQTPNIGGNYTPFNVPNRKTSTGEIDLTTQQPSQATIYLENVMPWGKKEAKFMAPLIFDEQPKVERRRK